MNAAAGVPILVASRVLAAQLGRLQEIVDEGERAHAKHGATSMRSQPWNAHRRFTIIAEELGELAEPINDLDHGAISELQALRSARAEAVQCCAMLLDWLTAIDDEIAARGMVTR